MRPEEAFGADGMSIFTLARRIGTSIQMIDSTYGHLAQDAEDRGRGLLDACDAASEPGRILNLRPLAPGGEPGGVAKGAGAWFYERLGAVTTALRRAF